MNLIQDKIRGSLIGGAVGDALGYAVEFLSEGQIFAQYGPEGITAYDPDRITGTAVISDDTQMTLFTANALLFGAHRQKERGISANPRQYALYAYLGWRRTQDVPYSRENRIPDGPSGWVSDLLRDIPELYVKRAPGLTCMGALDRRREQADNGEYIEDFIADPVNNSKGCGGVMRVAPLGMAIDFWDMERLDAEGAQLAAITHSHSLGYLPAAVLVHIVNRAIYSPEPVDLPAIVRQARDTVAALYKTDPHIRQLTEIIDLAIALSENGDSDLENIHKLGEGWVAEEALAIALYCCLKYRNDFSKAVIAAVNHKGDSDSTGAVTGNIIGALVGYEAIEAKWKASLELHTLLLNTADALFKDFH